VGATLLAKIRTEEQPEVDAVEAQKVIDQLRATGAGRSSRPR
jgi:hypothetical protein